MKILMSCRQHPYHLCGGLSIASWNTAKIARDIGHEVVYLTGARPDKVASVEEGIQVYWLKGMSHEADGYDFLYNHLRNTASRLADEFDLFHSQSSALTPLLDTGKPIVFQDHGTMMAAMQDDHNQNAFGQKHTPFYDTKVPYHKMYGEFTRFIAGKEVDYLRRFTRVLSTSEISFMDLCTRYYLKNVRLFHHAIYGVENSTPRASNNLPVVGFFALGLDSPQKSVIHGMKQLLPIKDKVMIKVVGRGNKVPKFAKENFPHVKVTGYLKENEAIDALKEMDVLFESSCHHRGCNLTAITALGLGIPVVAYPTGGHMDLIGEEGLVQEFGVGGALIDPMKGNACNTIMHILKNRPRFSESAIKHFNEVFSPKACAENLKAIYEEICE